MGIKIKKFQMGGGMPMEDPAMAGGAPMGPEGGAPPMEGAPGGDPAAGGDPVMQLIEMATQALQSQDPNMALAVCEGLVSMAQGGVEGGAPAPGGAPEEPVMMRKGGKICGKKKKKC